MYGDKHGRVPLFPCFTVTLTYTRVTFVGRVVLWYFQVGGIFLSCCGESFKAAGVDRARTRPQKYSIGKLCNSELQSFL